MRNRVLVGAVVGLLAMTPAVVQAAEDDGPTLELPPLAHPVPDEEQASPGEPDPGLLDQWMAGSASPSGEATPEARAITVTPDVDLVDGQGVTVDGTGFGGDPLVGIVQCARGLGLDGCDLGSVKIFNPSDGTFSEVFPVRAIIETNTGAVDCRTFPAGCRLIANDHYGLDGAGTASIALDPAGPIAPSPTVTVAPNTDLVDGQVVDVTGSQFFGGQTVTLLQCRAGTTEPDDGCTNYAETEASLAGDIDADYQVAAILELYHFEEGVGPAGLAGIEQVDCRLETCLLLAVDGAGPDRVVSAPLAFDPDGALRPVMALTVTPHTGLVDGQVVDVAVSGYTPDGPVTVIECSFFSDTEGSGCDFSTRQQLTTDADGALQTTFAVKDQLDSGDGVIDCHSGDCILVAVDLSVPVSIGEGYLFESLSFIGAGGPTDPVDPAVVSPAFTG